MIEIHSTWGTLAVVESTGFVVKADSFYASMPGEEGGELRDIVRFDIAEHREFWRMPSAVGGDILDFGYWTEDGHYEPPCTEWRRKANPIP